MNTILRIDVTMLEFMTFTEVAPAKLIYGILRGGTVYIWNIKNILSEKKIMVNRRLILVEKYYFGIFKIL